MNKFEALGLNPTIVRAVTHLGFETPTPIQAKCIPFLLEGKDIFGSAQTGTGKTAAFALPILQLLADNQAQHRREIKALVLAPTRELAQQINDSFRDYGKGLHLKHIAVYGGVSQHGQTQALRNGIDILIATPGRLLDLMNQGFVKLGAVRFFVLDEVDRMLDMGFINDIKKIIHKLPPKKQTLFFSATASPEIKRLADTLLHHPAIVQENPASSAPLLVKQLVYFVSKVNKKALLKEILLQEKTNHLLVFTRTKRGADRLVKDLLHEGIKADAIHGDKTQGARQKALDRFKNRSINMLVATDVASRGLDITDISHVINYDLPMESETYIHRIGRTGRAGAEGMALTFCSPDERNLLRNIQRLVKNNLEIVSTHSFSSTAHHSEPKHEDKPAGEKKFFQHKEKWNHQRRKRFHHRETVPQNAG